MTSLNRTNLFFIGGWLILTLLIGCKSRVSKVKFNVFNDDNSFLPYNDQYLTKSDQIRSLVLVSDSLVRCHSIKDGFVSEYSLLEKDSLKTFFDCPSPVYQTWGRCAIKTKDTSSLRIAIDPGHLADNIDMARVEGKYIELYNDSIKKDVSFFEGELTYLTAELLRDSLKALGYEVMISHQKGKSAMGVRFFDWFKDSIARNQMIDSCIALGLFTLEQDLRFNTLIQEDSLLAQKYIFHKVFKYVDFYARAKKINEFSPDATVIVHYNVDVNNKPWDTSVDKNYSMAFVPGAVGTGELKTIYDCNQLVRLAVSDQIKNSIKLSETILNAIEASVLVPRVEDVDSISYLRNYCIKTKQKGVFCRNLAMTRLVKSPLCYLEAFYQDNHRESCLLDRNSLPGGYQPQRIKEVSSAIIQGIQLYFEQTRLK